MKGRKPTPLKIKKLRGNPGKRPMNNCEPATSLDIPQCPSHFDGLVKAEWDRITKLLYDAGMIAEMDLAVIAGYCESFSRWIETSEKLKTTGLLIRAPSGYPIVNPLLSISNKAKEQMLKFAQELGLSIVQRSRIKVEKRPLEIDPIDALLRKK